MARPGSPVTAALPRALNSARRKGLQDADAKDVCQEVFRAVAESVDRWDPKRGSFRGWLKTLTRHAWCDLAAERRRAGQGGGDGRVEGLLGSLQAGDELVEQLDMEFRREVMDRAMERVRRRVAARTWDAFRLTALEGWSGAEAAGRLEMKVARVYGARSEVKEMIREEVRNLEGLE